jgi:hypothetical protein
MTFARHWGAITMSKSTDDKGKRTPDKSPPPKGGVGKAKPGKDELGIHRVRSGSVSIPEELGKQKPHR